MSDFELEHMLSNVQPDSRTAGMYFDSNTITLQDQLPYIAFNEYLEVEPQSVINIKLLGEGNFGDVFLGILNEAGAHRLVALKRPKVHDEFRTSPEKRAQKLHEERESLRDELKIMTHVGEHPNVVQLFGAITKSRDDFCIILDYCELGSLEVFLQMKFTLDLFVDELVREEETDCHCFSTKEYFKAQKERTWKKNFNARRQDGLITTSDLLWFALQISRAMDFLEKHKVLHRDVALRNVLLKRDFSLKVADFGLSRVMIDEQSYCVLRNFNVPFRYVSPESLLTGRFTTQSEYWAFGVVLWELFTFAIHQPYSLECTSSCGSNAAVQDIVNFLESGQRLDIPERTPKEIRNLILKLWNSDPSTRPSFAICQEKFQSLLLLSCPEIIELQKLRPTTLENGTASSIDYAKFCGRRIALFPILILLAALAATFILLSLSAFGGHSGNSKNDLIKSHLGVNGERSLFCLQRTKTENAIFFDGQAESFHMVDLNNGSRSHLEQENVNQFDKLIGNLPWTVRAIHAVDRRPSLSFLLALLSSNSTQLSLTSYRINYTQKKLLMKDAINIGFDIEEDYYLSNQVAHAILENEGNRGGSARRNGDLLT